MDIAAAHSPLVQPGCRVSAFFVPDRRVFRGKLLARGPSFHALMGAFGEPCFLLQRHGCTQELKRKPVVSVEPGARVLHRACEAREFLIWNLDQLPVSGAGAGFDFGFGDMLEERAERGQVPNEARAEDIEGRIGRRRFVASGADPCTERVSPGARACS